MDIDPNKRTARFRVDGPWGQFAELWGYPAPAVAGTVAMIRLSDWPGHQGWLHPIYPDGLCSSCNEHHGWLLDAALDAGWQCPALEAAVAERLATGE